MVFISIENNFCHSDHRPYKPLALALLSLYYMSDGIIKLKLKLKLYKAILTGKAKQTESCILCGRIRENA